MTLTCGSCGYENMDGLGFCESCGGELTDSAASAVAAPAAVWIPGSVTAPSDAELEEIDELDLKVGSDAVLPPIEPISASSPVEFPGKVVSPVLTPARLIAKTAGSPISEFALTEESCVVGKFDPDLGPVEVDLDNFPDADYISRSHARVFWDAGQWKVEDNNSANGVFLKKCQDSRFIKVTIAEILEEGDEVSFAKIRFIFQS